MLCFNQHIKAAHEHWCGINYLLFTTHYSLTGDLCFRKLEINALCTVSSYRTSQTYSLSSIQWDGSILKEMLLFSSETRVSRLPPSSLCFDRTSWCLRLGPIRSPRKPKYMLRSDLQHSLPASRRSAQGMLHNCAILHLARCVWRH